MLGFYLETESIPLDSFVTRTVSRDNEGIHERTHSRPIVAISGRLFILFSDWVTVVSVGDRDR
jgi:hypothetical protein